MAREPWGAVEGIDYARQNATEYLRELPQEYLRVLEVQDEGHVPTRNNEIRNTRSGALACIQPGDVILKHEDIIDVRKMLEDRGNYPADSPLLADLTLNFVIYRPEHRLPEIGGEIDV